METPMKRNRLFAPMESTTKRSAQLPVLDARYVATGLFGHGNGTFCQNLLTLAHDANTTDDVVSQVQGAMTRVTFAKDIPPCLSSRSGMAPIAVGFFPACRRGLYPTAV
jgi:hypothetical protein